MAAHEQQVLEPRAVRGFDSRDEVFQSACPPASTPPPPPAGQCDDAALGLCLPAALGSELHSVPGVW